MGNAKHISRVGAPTAALRVGNVRAVATRLTVSIGAAAVVVMATVVPATTASASTLGCKPTDVTCALILGGTGGPTPDDAYIATVRNQFIAPTHPTQPGQEIGYDAVTTPEELWPLTGVARLLGLALGPPELFGLGGIAWPDEPLWKLSGLFDLTADQSVQAGAADLEDAIAEHANEHLVISGYSQGAGVANVVKQRLAAQYPAGTDAPDIDFVLIGDPNLPNGGIASRFAGLYIPILDFSFNGPARTDTPFDTVEITRQYDGFTDFPLYPLNLVADLNAVLGVVYVHMYMLDVRLPADDPRESPAYRGKYGDTSYYFFDNPDLPLFGPLRTLGVPEKLIDVVEPFFKVIVELGYDRTIPAWEPTPARLIPTLNPGTVATDLVNAIGEGLNNAAALIGSPAPLSTPAAVTAATVGPAAPAASEAGRSDVSPQVTPADTRTETEQLTSAKPSVRPATPRPVVRGSLEVREQLRDLPHRGNGGHPTTRTGAAGHGAATAAPSPVASSPAASKGRNSSDGHSSGGDAGDS